MKNITLLAAALTAFAGMASAQPTLTSASEVVLQTLAPDLNTSDLTSVQVRRINQEVSSNDGLTQPMLGTIVGH